VCRLQVLITAAQALSPNHLLLLLQIRAWENYYPEETLVATFNQTSSRFELHPRCGRGAPHVENAMEIKKSEIE
jgi:hypothetical protein